MVQTQNELAEFFKKNANALFGQLKYSEAAEEYSKAIELDPSVPVYWANRAFANIKLENYGYAIMDAEEAIKLDPAYIKVSNLV